MHGRNIFSQISINKNICTNLPHEIFWTDAKLDQKECLGKRSFQIITLVLASNPLEYGSDGNGNK